MHVALPFLYIIRPLQEHLLKSVVFSCCFCVEFLHVIFLGGRFNMMQAHFAGRDNNPHKSWAFTANNYRDAHLLLLRSLECKRIVFGKGRASTV